MPKLETQISRVPIWLDRSPWWLKGGQAQTIWASTGANQCPVPKYIREKWDAPDGDFIDVDIVHERTSKNLLILFHGLEGSSSSHYAVAFAEYAARSGMSYAVAHFRGCGGTINIQNRAYHSGDFHEIDWILRRFRGQFKGRVIAVGVSLGGNALLRWAEEIGAEAKIHIDAIASVCAPLDLMASGQALGRGFNRWTYTPMFLRSMRKKALAKLSQFPGLFDREKMINAKSLYEFDQIFTAPLHGFKSTEDYWIKASSKERLDEIKIPSLIVNAINDPFVPISSVCDLRVQQKWVTLWQPQQGGHVGFVNGGFPGHLRILPAGIGEWFMQHI